MPREDDETEMRCIGRFATRREATTAAHKAGGGQVRHDTGESWPVD